MKNNGAPYTSTTNACKLCKPLGACIAFRGIEGAIPFLHGSQGCATYMRRYIISHFREPMDIASSSLGEKHAVYGGGPNLKQGLKNVTAKYGAKLIGIATTCLTETIGDDVSMLLREYRHEMGEAGASADLPAMAHVSTPSYSGTHMEGFHAAVKAVVDQLTTDSVKTETVSLLPGFLSPADLRCLREILDDFGLESVVLPDISETLDAPSLEEYKKIPDGGTPLPAIRAMGGARATIEFGRTLFTKATAGKLLEERFKVPLHRLGAPIGLRETDSFIAVLEELAGRKTPKRLASERGRLIDAYVDAHKYVFGKRAIVYGEEDLVVGITAFLAEIGVKPVLCATGGGQGSDFSRAIAEVTESFLTEPPIARAGADFHDIAGEAGELAPDILIGHSKGYHLARKWKIPLVRVGFPIHDRFGGQRTLHVGYRGSQSLLDRVVNAVIEKKQEDSPVGYSYI
jgi:nitrogenase molybdenum-iron protein NifN